MIIKHLHIDDFGCFHEFDLDLEQGVNIISQPNEFGKTTLLEFIRRIFWGFPDKRRKQLNPYPGLNGSGHYGGFLDVVMADGRELRLERRGVKGNLKIISSDGGVEEVENIASFAGISENFYRNICAVTIDELTAFAAVDSDEVKNLIYGNAFNAGEFSLSEVQEKLSLQAEAIFKKRGSNNILKKIADEFALSEERLAKAAGNLGAYERSVLNAEKLEESAGKIKKELDVLQKEIEYCKKTFEVIQKGKLLAAEEKIFAEKKVPDPMPEPLPVFDKKPPELPQELVLPEQIKLPPEPDLSAIAGLCDISRAVKITDKDIADAEEWHAAGEKLQKECRRFLKLMFIPVVIGIIAIAGIVSGLPQIFCIIAGVLDLAAWALWIKNGFAVDPLRNSARLEKCREDMVFRFALNPTVKGGSIAEILKKAKDLQLQQEKYDETVKTVQLQTEKTEKLRREYEIRRKLYDDALAVYSRERNEYDKKRVAFEELCRIRSKALAEYESEKSALAEKIEAWKKNAAESQIETFDEGKLEILQQKYDDLKGKLEDNLRFSGAERREAELLVDGVDSALELNIREQLRGKMRSAAERYLVLKSAEAVLKKAIERCERERQPELLENASEWFAGFTCGTYTRVYRQISSGSLRVGNVETGADRDAGVLSRGTREQLFLALRLALIRALENSSEPLPVILDDVLVNFDPRRRRAVMAGLEKFAEARQILILDNNTKDFYHGI